MAVDVKQTTADFEAHFGKKAELAVRAPGRVNIIGEHTDYNAGFVLPMAMNCETVIVARRRSDGILNACAANLDRSAQADLKSIRRHKSESWMDYLLGVANELAKLGKPLHGADVLIHGDVPVGSGLSSSASLEMATLVLFETLGDFRVEGPEAPLLGQRVENEFLGLKTGIMDQFVVREARKGHALFLDCRSLAHEQVAVAFDGAVFVVADTGVARGLAASKYNERVAECAEAVDGINRRLGKTGTHLRDFLPEDIDACRGVLPDAVFRRARHVVTENERTLEACKAFRAGDIATLGQLMDASDFSLQRDYEVTCPELETITEIGRSLPGCYGSRMTGAGFGGCTVHLVDAERVTAFSEALRSGYATRTGLTAKALVSFPAEGASRIY